MAEKIIYDGDIQEYQSIIENGYEFKMSDYISEGWETFKANPWQFIGYGVLVSVLSSMAGIIPLVGIVLQVAVSIALQAGFFIMARKIRKGEEYEFADFFKGFDHFSQLIVLGFMQMLVMVGAILVPVGLVVGVMLGMGMDIEDPTFILAIIAAMLPLIYFGIAYQFAVPLVVFGRLKYWDAMETSRKIIGRNFWSFFAMIFVYMGLALAGLMVLIIGVIAVTPLIYCINYAMYEDIVGSGDIWLDKIDEIGTQIEEEDGMEFFR